MSALLERVAEAIAAAETVDDPAAAREAIRAVAKHIADGVRGQSLPARTRRLVALELYEEARR